MRSVLTKVARAARRGVEGFGRNRRGLLVAALAFACGAGVEYAARRATPTSTAGSYAVSPLPCETIGATLAAPAGAGRAGVSVRDTYGGEGEDVVFEGRYENLVYGYSVEIPAGMVGVGSTPPAPQHGFGINLDSPGSAARDGGPRFPKSYVYVDGSYNSLEWSGPDDAADDHLKYLREEGGGVRVRSRAATRLGGLRAVRAVALYGGEGGEEMVYDAVFAFRRGEGGETSAVYTLALRTPASKYERDRAVLEALRASWRLQPAE